MKKLALSVAVLMVAGAGISASAIGCSSSSSTGGNDSGTAETSTGDDSSTGDSATGDDSSTTDSGTVDTGTPPADGGAEAAACTSDAGLVILGGDGGLNTACMSGVSSSCGQEQCVCLTDTNLVPDPTSDAGGMIPTCGYYVGCVYQTVSYLAATTDAGLTADLTQAQAACAANGDAGALPSSSTGGGDALIGCIVTNAVGGSGLTAACLP